MALHGEVKINGYGIVDWQAQRIDAVVSDDDQVSRYRWEVVTEYGAREHGILEHRYGDGAIVLAAKVLAEAAALGLSTIDRPRRPGRPGSTAIPG